MTATEKDQAAGPDPRPDRLAISLFGSHLNVLELPDVWSRAGISASLQSIEKRDSPVPVKRATGVVNELAFDFTIVPDQAVLAIGPAVEEMQRMAAARKRVFGIPEFHSGLNWLCETARGLLDAFPPVFRIAIQGSFLWDFDTAEECASFIRARMPALASEQSLGEDLVFQVNRPKRWDDGVINQILGWQTFPAQILGSTQAGSPPSLTTFWVARLSTDVNNKPDPQKAVSLELLTVIRKSTEALVHAI